MQEETVLQTELLKKSKVQSFDHVRRVENGHPA